MRTLNSLGGGIDRGMPGLRGVPGAVGGLLQHPGNMNQQNNLQIPSQDVLAIMSRSNARGPGVPSGLFNMGQMQGMTWKLLLAFGKNSLLYRGVVISNCPQDCHIILWAYQSLIVADLVENVGAFVLAVEELILMTE